MTAIGLGALFVIVIVLAFTGQRLIGPEEKD